MTHRKVPKEYYREWRRRHKTPERLADNSARVRSYYEKHPEKKKEAWRRFTAKHGTKRRKSARIAYAVAAVMKRGSYTPRISRRKPEYAPVGAPLLDVRSQWLVNNLTDEQRAYARELAIERKAPSSKLNHPTTQPPNHLTPMTHTDAQIEIALLASIERQARRTAAALERVLALRRELKNSEKELKRQCRQRRQPRR